MCARVHVAVEARYSRILKLGCGRAEVQVHRGRERPHRVVRRDRDVMRLGDRGDLAHLEQAADDADVGLDDVGAARRSAGQELEAAVEHLAGGERAPSLRLQLGPGGDVLGPDRLLEEQRVVGRERVAELDRLPRLEDLGVGVEGELVVARAISRSSAK